MTITGINTIRNGVETGYPFIESILSVLPLVDEYLINDGGSTDGTLQHLMRLSEAYPKVKVYNIPDKPNVRWDCISDVLNEFIEKAKGDWIFLGNADELLHEQDIPAIRCFIEETDWPIVRYQRKEVVQGWTKIGKDVYHPARTARKVPGLYQNWNSYGGDEFLTPEGWIDPDRTLQSDFVIYHLYAVFPHNMVNKRRNDAEWLAPGDAWRVSIYENLKGSSYGEYVPPHPDDVCPMLPALARGLVQMGAYEVREELFDSECVSDLTGLPY